MSDSRPPSDDIDPGEPVAEIATLGESPNAGFLRRIRSRILRRISVSHFLDFVLPMVLGFLRELGQGLFGSPGPPASEATRDE